MDEVDGREMLEMMIFFSLEKKGPPLSPFQQSFFEVLWGGKISMNPGKRGGNKKMIGGVHVLIPNHSLFRISNLLQFLT